MFEYLYPCKKGMGILKKNISSPFSIFINSQGRIEHPPIPFIPIKKGKGPYLYDFDGNRYVDFDLSRGSLILGHSPPNLTKVIKSWLSRGFAGGYYSISLEMLSKSIYNSFIMTLSDTPYDEQKWSFYDSPVEAYLAVLYLMESLVKRRNGLLITDPSLLKSHQSIFGNTFLKCVSFESLEGCDPGSYDYVILRWVRGLKKVSLEDFLNQAVKRDLKIISDETELESHMGLRENKSFNKYIDVRILGSWISSGLSFGCVIAKKELFFQALYEKESSLFDELRGYIGFPPLYKVKATIGFLRVLMKYGGLKVLIEKIKGFYAELKEEYFEMANGMIYMRGSNHLKKNYENFRLDLLRNGTYFPFTVQSPIFISFVHSEELLEKCAERISASFKNF